MCHMHFFNKIVNENNTAKKMQVAHKNASGT